MEYGLRGFLGGKPLPVRPLVPYSRADLRKRADLPAAAGSAGGNDGLRLSPYKGPLIPSYPYTVIRGQ